MEGAKRLAKKLGAVHIRQHKGHGVSSGWPDSFFAFPNGSGIWIEFKAPGEVPTPLQNQRIMELRGLGHTVLVCDSVDKAREIFASALGGDAWSDVG